MADQVSISIVNNGATINAGAVTSVTAGTGLTGGTITSSGTISANFGVASGTICQGNDSRLSDSRTPTVHATSHQSGGSDPITIAESQVTNLTTDLAARALTTTSINTGTGLSGGGTLAADRTLSVIFGTSGSSACAGNDSRLSDARTPTTHGSTHSYGGSDAIPDNGLAQSQVSGLTTALAGKVPTTRSVIAGTALTGGGSLGSDVTLNVSFGTTSTTACAGNDYRLSNTRQPQAHAPSHAADGSDPITIDVEQVNDLNAYLNSKVDVSRAVNSGTGLSGGGTLNVDRTLSVNYGTTSTTACVGNDSRLSDARTPTSHASTHAAAGSDPLTLSQSQVTNLTSDLSARALTATSITAGTGLTGGGTLAANRTLAVSFGTSSSTVCVGNDSRLSDSRTPTGTASGDLSGTYPSPTVNKIQGVGLSVSSPSDGDILRYVASTGLWTSGGSEDVQLFTSSGTWTKPLGCKSINIICIGGGGGAGSGHADNSGTRGGGGAGAGGAITELTYRASAIPATLTVTVGAGGTGGAGVSSGTNGNNGTAGGASYVALSGVQYAYANGGNYGAGGTGSGGTGGAAQTNGSGMWLGEAGGSGGGAAAGTAGDISHGGPGGGGGGGISTSGTVYNGGNGGTRLYIGTGGSGTSGSAGSNVGFYGSGGGGSPSAIGTSAAGGAGGYGAGGGGSGAGVIATGAGGAGGGGIVCIISSW